MGSRVGGFRAQGFRVQPCFKESPDNPLGHRVSHIGLGVSEVGLLVHDMGPSFGD